MPLHIFLGAQFGAEFLPISPNSRIPAIVDDGPVGGGAAFDFFESGAILQYLSEKAGEPCARQRSFC